MSSRLIKINYPRAHPCSSASSLVVCWHTHTYTQTLTHFIFLGFSPLARSFACGFSLVILIPISHAVFCVLFCFSLYFTPPLLINYVCHFCQAEGCIAALLKLLSLSFSPSLALSLSLALALCTQDRVCSLRAHCSSARTQRAPSSTPPATIVTRPWPWATACPHHKPSSLSPLHAPAASPEELCTATTRWALLLSLFPPALITNPSLTFVFSPPLSLFFNVMTMFCTVSLSWSGML